MVTEVRDPMSLFREQSEWEAPDLLGKFQGQSSGETALEKGER